MLSFSVLILMRLSTFCLKSLSKLCHVWTEISERCHRRLLEDASSCAAFGRVKLLKEKELNQIFSQGNLEIIMPDEDVNRNFAQQHLGDKNVKFIPAFLRWGSNQISSTELKVDADELPFLLTSATKRLWAKH